MVNNSNSTMHPYLLLLSLLTRYQCGLIKGHLVNMDNWFNEVFPSFNPLNLEFKPGDRIIDCFLIVFHLFSKSSDCLFKS